jgi:hypothetical protein
MIPYGKHHIDEKDISSVINWLINAKKKYRSYCSCESK